MMNITKEKKKYLQQKIEERNIYVCVDIHFYGLGK